MKKGKKAVKHFSRVILALLLAVSMIPLPAAASASSDNGDGTYNNPVIYADVPDVDVIRVGDTYYMSSTTMHLSPGVPIMKSKDLVNWEIVNYVYDVMDDGDAMSLRNGQSAYANGSWASSLRYYDGKYYVSFMSYTTGKTYFYTTDDIENGVWTHTEVKGGYHDMGLFFDDDGKIYMAYGGGTIKICEMEIVENGLQIKPGTEKVLISDAWKGTALEGTGGLAEGTHVQKINGKYYVFMITWPAENADAGTKGMRTELCFRADSIEDFVNGNWERKIVLQDKGAAQGGIIDTVDGDWYGMVFRDMGPVGRCPVLVPVTWTDRWPMMGNEKGEVDDTAVMPLESWGEKSVVTSDEFYNGEERAAYTKQYEMYGATGVPTAADVDEEIEALEVYDGDELIENGSFDDGTEHWTVNDPADIEVVEEDGNKILKVTNRTTTGSGPRQDITGDVVEGGTYKITAKIKYDHPNSPATKNFNMCIYNGKSYVNGDSIQIMGSGTITKGEWGTVSGTFTVKEGTDISASAIFLETSWAANPTADNDLMDFYVDDVSVIAESIPKEEGDNLIKNGGFEDELSRWTGRENCTLTLDTTEKVSGNSSVKVTDRKVTGSGPQQDVSGLLEAGDIIDVSYNIKYTTGPDTRNFILTAFYDGTYKNIVGGNVKKGEWTKISSSYTVPEDMNTDNLVFFLETSWTPEQDPENDRMDYYVDDLVVTKRVIEQPTMDERSYNGSNLKLEWQWNHNPNNACWSLTDRAGYLRMTTGSTCKTLTEARNTLTQRTYAPQCSGNVALEVGNMKNGDVAGLAAFAAKYGYVGVKMDGGKKYLVMVGTKENGSDNFEPYEADSVELTQDRVYLKIDFDFNSNKAYFYYSLDGKSWTKIGDELPMVYSLAHFMGYRFGLFNYATKSTGGYVDFDYFRIEDGNSGTEGTKDAGTAKMENVQAAGVANAEVEIPVKMTSLPEGNYKSISASFGIPSQLKVTDVVFNEKNVTGTATYSYSNGQLLLTVNGEGVGYTATEEDDVFATIKLKAADYVTADIDATVQADYIQTTGDKVSYDVSGAKSVVTLKYVDMGALAKKPGDSNPLVDHKFGADPYAMEYDGRVYIYMTNDSQEYEAQNNGSVDNTYGNINTINVISSADMVNWTDHGSIPVAGKNNPDGAAKWATCSWAPAAAHKTIDGKEKFFLYFADGGGGIGVLEADSPIGPFVDPIGQALVPPGSAHADGVIWLFDPAVLVDDDGTGYLYYGGGVPDNDANNPKTSRVVKLTDDMVHLDGDAQVIDAPAIFEDSGIHKYGEKYYYSYCSNFSQHAAGYPGQGIICYMESDSPMGPFEYKGEILDNPAKFFGVGGNNHHAIFEFGGEYYITYHAQTLGKALGKANGYRSTHINKVNISKDGTIEPITADMKGISLLKTVDPYARLEGEMFAWNSGIKTAVSKQEGSMVKTLNMEVTDIQNGDWTAIAGLDFGVSGAKKLTANIAAKEGGKVEIRLDSADGTLAGTLEVPAGDGNYKKVECELEGVTGEHNVFFVFTGADGKDLMTVDYWQFEETEVKVDKTDLKEAIDKATAVDITKYTEETVEKLQEALAKANEVFKDDNATQQEVDDAAKALTDAQEALKEIEKPEPVVTDKKALEAAVKAAVADTEKAKYTEESWAAYEEALKKAEEVLAKEDATQQEIDDAVAALDKAAKALQAKGLPYEDVVESDWFYDEVAYNYYEEIMTGMDPTHFGPYVILPRAQFATILHRIEGKPAAEYTNRFPDVPDGQFYSTAVLWAADAEVITGYTDSGYFGTNDPITREQMVTMMYRYAEYKKYESKEPTDISAFTDADEVTEFAEKAMKWAVANGIIAGKENEDGSYRLDPQGGTSRAECAIIIQRFMEKFEK